MQAQASVEAKLVWQYDIRRCVYWIVFNNYKRVCLQFPDNLLIDSYTVAKLLERETHAKIFILGDTTYNSCCVDYVNARHVQADSIIHFGRACLTSIDVLPTLYILPKNHLDIRPLCDTIDKLAQSTDQEIFLLYDVSYTFLIEDIICELTKLKGQLRVSRLATPQQKVDGLKWHSSDRVVTKFGRLFSLPANTNEKTATYIYLFDNKYTKNLHNFVLTYPVATFYKYENGKPLEPCSYPEIVKRRNFLIQKVREANRVGVLVCTLTTTRYLEAINRIKSLCKLRNKKSYIISVGKLNVPKLANFPEIDVFAMIGCSEFDIPAEEFYRPVVTITEVELALNENQDITKNSVSDYREYLQGGSMYQKFNENIQSADVDITTNMGDQIIDINESNKTVALKENLTISSLSCLNNGLSGRTWQGLEYKIGNKPVTKAEIGLCGTPSGGYAHPSTDFMK